MMIPACLCVPWSHPCSIASFKYFYFAFKLHWVFTPTCDFFFLSSSLVKTLKRAKGGRRINIHDRQRFRVIHFKKLVTKPWKKIFYLNPWAIISRCLHAEHKLIAFHRQTISRGCFYLRCQFSFCLIEKCCFLFRLKTLGTISQWRRYQLNVYTHKAVPWIMTEHGTICLRWPSMKFLLLRKR